MLFLHAIIHEMIDHLKVNYQLVNQKRLNIELKKMFMKDSSH